jgi:phosphatidate cytidylyltransferase
MLRWRLLGAAVILIPLLALIYADYAYNFGYPGLWLLLPTIVAIVLATEEVLALLNSDQLKPSAWTVYTGVLLLTLSACAPLFYSFTGGEYPPDCPLGRLGLTFSVFALCIPLAFAGEMLRYQKPGGVIINVALALFVMAYLGVNYSFLIWLRFWESNQVGMAAVVSVIWIVKFSDTGAYAFGKTLGRTKMTPLLSPNKTIEGALGGIFIACVAAVVYFQYLVPWVTGASPIGTWRGWLVYAVLVTIAGMVGDLAESLLKRDMEQKDSSSWLRGLGGVLDLMDSVLLAAPVAYLCWALGVVKW